MTGQVWDAGMQCCETSPSQKRSTSKHREATALITAFQIRLMRSRLYAASGISFNCERHSRAIGCLINGRYATRTESSAGY